MPQASSEQRAEWSGPDESTAVKYLQDAGYRQTRGWRWRLPNPDHTPTAKELSAIQFLMDEWDMGGIVPEPGKTNTTIVPSWSRGNAG